ncbi:hypothetical protein BDZ45DRAFT_84506 [Acephala macrosclerotiorum]|nr:hypothetical protein BDZ45DRAFT_84506 [Acephala macrosclerotiorum]
MELTEHWTAIRYLRGISMPRITAMTVEQRPLNPLTRFSRLPTEIQLMIWAMAAVSPRVFAMHENLAS